MSDPKARTDTKEATKWTVALYLLVIPVSDNPMHFVTSSQQSDIATGRTEGQI
ncbi:hypothetical protein [Zymomonas mobilis]|uniref:hypothetical protein n=1 Tax=Zymomonas mobilis TaxID=542 RepID=UPI00163ACA7D|nr:hypothetical protein [Zymomonas mobilis]